jgi:hypothetical protein
MWVWVGVGGCVCVCVCVCVYAWVWVGGVGGWVWVSVGVGECGCMCVCEWPRSPLRFRRHTHEQFLSDAHMSSSAYILHKHTLLLSLHTDLVGFIQVELDVDYSIR